MVASCFFKSLVAVSSLLMLADFALNIAATIDFKSTMDDYSDRADEISKEISGDEASNFKDDSTFFLSLSTEYDALSDFDKEYVYCDIYSIQSDPNALEDNSKEIFKGALFTIGLTVVVHLVANTVLFRVASKPANDVENMSVWYRKLYHYNLDSAFQFAEVGPMLAIVALMAVRQASLDSFSCQEKFYTCGKSGDCVMDDLMLDVPLNSSLLDIFCVNTIVTLSFAVGILNIAWNFAAGSCLWIGEGAGRLLLVPCIQLSLCSMTFLWVVWLECLEPMGTDGSDRKITVGVVIAVTVMFFLTFGAYFVFLMKGTMLNLGDLPQRRIADLQAVRDAEDPEKAVAKENRKRMMQMQQLEKLSESVVSHLGFWIILKGVVACIRFYCASIVLDWDVAMGM